MVARTARDAVGRVAPVLRVLIEADRLMTRPFQARFW